MKNIIVLLISAFCICSLKAQTVIQMVEDMGVYKIPCEVNGFKLNMVFDTGASSITLSLPIAQMMIDNGYISQQDIVGSGQALLGDGRIVDHTKVILRSVVIGGITLNNVDAIVLDRQTIPLAFGQSAIQRLGKVSIKGDKFYIDSPTGKVLNVPNSDYFERWDEQGHSYSNFTYCFAWKLPTGYDWKKCGGLEKHTVFRAEGGPFTVFVNAQVAAEGPDLWTCFDDMVELMDQLDVNVEKETGLLIYERTMEKCTIAGQKSIKTTFKEYVKDSRFPRGKEDFTEEYYIIWNGYMLIVAVKMPKEVYIQHHYGNEIAEILAGFLLTAKR